MKKINISHIKRHVADIKQASSILNLVRRVTPFKIQSGFKKIIKANGSFYFAKGSSAYFDINQAIEEVAKVNPNSCYKTQSFDYAACLDILYLVLEDRVKYGDMIPDTADTFKDEYNNSFRIAKPRKNYIFANRQKRLKEKRKKQREFIERYNKICI
jgi:hypothetical protein